MVFPHFSIKALGNFRDKEKCTEHKTCDEGGF